jgi:membrane protein
MKRLSRNAVGIRNRAPWKRILGHTLHEFHENDLFTSAAAMSYFGLLTLFPVLLLLLALSDQLGVGRELIVRVVEIYPASREFLQDTLRSFENVRGSVVLSCIGILLWAGSWVFAVIERALNRMWNTRPRKFLRGRAVTIAMIGGVGLLLVTSVVITSMLVTLRQAAAQMPLYLLERIPLLVFIGSAFWQLILAFSSLLLTFSLFVLVYRFMPNLKLTLRETLPGALAAGLLWEEAKYIFASSLRYFHYDQIYGSVGAVIALMTWSYVSSLILLFGAQLTAIIHRDYTVEETEPEELDILPLKET